MAEGPSNRFERLSQRMTMSPAITPMTAAIVFFFRENTPSRNNPSIPPLNMEASFHQASSALFTLIMAMAIQVPEILITSEDIYNIRIDCLSEGDLLKKRL